MLRIFIIAFVLASFWGDAALAQSPADAISRQEQLQKELIELAAKYNGSTPEMEAEFAVWEQKLRQEVPWEVLDVGNFDTATGGAVWEKQPDGSVLVRSGMAAKSDYVVKCVTPLLGITALRLEALPDDSLPARGPGNAPNGNAVVTELWVTATPTQPMATKAQFVRVEAPGKGRYLHLAEVEVMAGGKNIALGAKATQISTDNGGEAARAIDGNRDGDYNAGSTTHTAATDNPWWEVDLGQEFPIDEIILSNRTDGGMAGRIAPFKVAALNAQHQVIWNHDSNETPMTGFVIKVADVRRHLILHNATATFSQVSWEVSKAVDGDAKTGWAFSPQFGERHAAVFEVADPLDFGEGNQTALEFTIQQQYGQEHTLGRFRLSATTSPQPVVALSPTALAVLNKPVAERSAAETQIMRELFRPSSKVLTALAVEIEHKQKELSAILPPTPPPPTGTEISEQQPDTNPLPM